MDRKRKLVFTPEQLEELIGNPKMSTAIFSFFRENPDATTREAFMYARAIMKQFDLLFPSEPPPVGLPPSDVPPRLDDFTSMEDIADVVPSKKR